MCAGSVCVAAAETSAVGVLPSRDARCPAAPAGHVTPGTPSAAAGLVPAGN